MHMPRNKVWKLDPELVVCFSGPERERESREETITKMDYEDIAEIYCRDILDALSLGIGPSAHVVHSRPSGSSSS